MRATRRPVPTSPVPSSAGSLIRPFQPTVERGFSKYTRITIEQVVGEPVGLLAQPVGVLAGGLRVVHRARADDDQQPRISAVEHVLHLAAAVQHGVVQVARSAAARGGAAPGSSAARSVSMRWSRTRCTSGMVTAVIFLPPGARGRCPEREPAACRKRKGSDDCRCLGPALAGVSQVMRSWPRHRREPAS